jgi:spermidine synthase
MAEDGTDDSLAQDPAQRVEIDLSHARALLASTPEGVTDYIAADTDAYDVPGWSVLGRKP